MVAAFAALRASATASLEDHAQAVLVVMPLMVMTFMALLRISASSSLGITPRLALVVMPLMVMTFMALRASATASLWISASSSRCVVMPLIVMTFGPSGGLSRTPPLWDHATWPLVMLHRPSWPFGPRLLALDLGLLRAAADPPPLTPPPFEGFSPPPSLGDHAGSSSSFMTPLSSLAPPRSLLSWGLTPPASLLLLHGRLRHWGFSPPPSRAGRRHGRASPLLLPPATSSSCGGCPLSSSFTRGLTAAIRGLLSSSFTWGLTAAAALLEQI